MQSSVAAIGTACVALVSLAHAPAALGDDGKVLNGPILLRFDRSLEELPVPRGKRFGIFQSQEPDTQQAISESFERVMLPDGLGEMGVLALAYHVDDGSSGWWLRLAPERQFADWRSFRDGYLMLRVLRSPPSWKVEIKDELGTYSAVVELTPVDRASIVRRGYTDIAIPLRSFGIRQPSRLLEFVVVVEGSRLERADRQGTLQLAQVGLSKAAEFSDDPDLILDELAARAADWFQKCRHPSTGLILDRGRNDREFTPDPLAPAMASVASCGYFLSLAPEWVRTGYLTEEEAERQVEQTLKFLVESTAHQDGLLFHFVDWRDGTRWANSEASVLDHAIAVNGAMTAAAAFGGEIDRLTNVLLERVDWDQFLTVDPRSGKRLLSLGATPERGLLGPADVRSSEMAMAYFLAIGSPKAIPAECWYNTTVDVGAAQGLNVLNPQHPLFTSMYGMNWHDLEGRKDRDGIDLFDNARQAALLNREFCRSLGKVEPTYDEREGGFYGLSAGDSPTGYRAVGPVPGEADGVVWPVTAIASLPWIPQEMATDLVRWRNSRAWIFSSGPYGLSPFRLGDRPWRAPDLIGIDLGSMAVSIANHKNRTIWKLWMTHPVAQRAYEKLGLPISKRR